MFLALYIFCLALGGVLIAASIFLGGHQGHDHDHDTDHDLGHDHDHDLGHDHDGDADGDHDGDHAGSSHFVAAGHDGVFADFWAVFLTMRFWTFGLAALGLTGLLLYLLRFSDIVSLVISLPTGIIVGFSVATLFRYLKRASNVGGASDTSRIRGVDGIVLLPIGPGRKGKVRIKVAGNDVDLPANTQDQILLEPRTVVLVVSVRDGVADVVQSPEKPVSR